LRSILLATSATLFVAASARAQNATPAPATTSIADSLAGEIRGVFEKARRSVVRIEATDKHGELSGTGFFINPAGTLYTSYTIGGESNDIVVCWGDGKMPAHRLFADPRSGIAVLKVDTTSPFLPIGSSKTLSMGCPLVAVGYPMDLPLSPSFGTVAGFDLMCSGRYFATRHIRANVPVQRGQGGAPVLNMRGEVVGILISSVDNGSSCFVLPIEAAEKLRRDFIRFGELRPGWLGIGIETARDAVSGSTAEISGLTAGSPGEKAGLHSGDVVVQINDRTITSPEDILDESFFIAVADDVKIKVDRHGEKLDFALTATDRPNNSNRTAGDVPTAAPAVSNDLRGQPMQLDQ
jgi:serine protease Do